MQDNTAKSFLDPILVSLMKKEVNKSKEAAQPVNRAFEVIAEKSGLKFNTVKNYYYRYIHEKNNTPRGPERDGEPPENGMDVVGSTFTDQEVKELMKAMLLGQAKGKSVRGCANELAKNDKRLMLRYQNKYRNVLSGDPKYLEELMKEMSNDGLVYYDPLRKQVIQGQSITAEGELFENLGRLVSNINEIRSPNLDSFFMGLHELSSMALMYKRKDSKKNQEQFLSIIDRLIAINKEFLDLPPAGKLTGLSEYIRQVEDCISSIGKVN